MAKRTKKEMTYESYYSSLQTIQKMLFEKKRICLMLYGFDWWPQTKEELEAEKFLWIDYLTFTHFTHPTMCFCAMWHCNSPFSEVESFSSPLCIWTSLLALIFPIPAKKNVSQVILYVFWILHFKRPCSFRLHSFEHYPETWNGISLMWRRMGSTSKPSSHRQHHIESWVFQLTQVFIWNQWQNWAQGKLIKIKFHRKKIS